MTKIASFTGRYEFLSNFYLCPVKYGGENYPSSENAYQAMKTMNPGLRSPFYECSPKEAKRFGRRLRCRPDWGTYRTVVMLDILHAKFSDKDLARKLIKTTPHELVEGNWWGDQFWGVCEGKGLNMLGRLLMVVRDTIIVAS